VFVAVIHKIHDPERFQAAEVEALEAGLPAGIALPIHGSTRDHRFGICLWEGESVTAVRDVVEAVVGPFADNEYYEMEVDGLVPQLQS
jgi:hypothetical protein